MATRFIQSGMDTPGGVGHVAGFGVDDEGNLMLNRGAEWKGGSLTTDPGQEHIPTNRVITLTASGSVTAADSGATIIADGSASVIVSLPATAKGLRYTLVTKQLPGSGAGTAFSPVAVDKFIYGAKADDADLVNSAASDAVGDSVTIIGDGADGWVVVGIRGTWA